MALRSSCSRIGWLARLATAGLISGSALFLASGPAEAHHYRHYRYHPPVAHAAFYARYAHRGRVHSVRQTVAAVSGSPAFSALVVDANSGKTLYAADENGLRHPASITKVMTLYLLFEKLDRGAMTLQTEIPISAHAAAQEPSKLGLQPGDTISVEDAIKAVVTRSANDVAVAIAEAVGQTEDNFADMMTRKAHELGMSSTLYRNASGLPNDEQLTTAHDLAILGRTLEERFPRYFHYFSTAEFHYDGEIIGNHNHLLGRVDGVDGIKTGYTRASGFNLLTSVHRDGRSLIAVVMGGRSAGGRDRIMEGLIADHLAEASTTRTATMIADAAPAATAEPSVEPAAAPPAREPPAIVAEGRIQRVSAATSAANAAGEGDDGAGDEETPAPPMLKALAAASARPSAKTQARLAAASALAMPPLGRPSPVEDQRRSARASQQDQDSNGPRARGSWIIQVGAADNPVKANALLTLARERNPSTLASAKPVTEKVRKGDATLYRARFAVLDSASAEAACRSLKRTGFSCFPAHD